MIRNPKPYKTTKDSAVKWLGKVPEHWTEKRAKYFYRESDELSESGDEELMSVSHKTGVTPRKSSVTMFLAESTVGYKICRPDDVAINTMWAFMGALGVARQVGIVSPSYGVYRPKRENNLLPAYADRLLRIDAYKSEYMCRSTGINSSRLRLYPDDFLRIPILCPPLSEQASIVRYLDHMDLRVRRLVKAKRKLIALMNEQKQATIHRAVTHGLDPDVPLKNSGVEWLGQIPEHWEVRRNGRLFSQRNETGFSHLPILEVSLKTGVRIRDFSKTERKQVMTDLGKYKRAISGDIAYNTMRMWQGAVGVVPANGLISPAYVIVRPLAGINSKYFNYLFKTPIYMQEVDNHSRGIVKDRNRLYWEYFKAIYSCFPPPEEQDAIVDHLDKVTAVINATVNRAEREIALLSEYRTRLIADVVTGKLDVREAAANLHKIDPLTEADVAVEADFDLEADTDEFNEDLEEVEA